MSADPGNATPDEDVLAPWLYVPMPDTLHPDTWARLPDGPVKAYAATRAADLYRALVAVADVILNDIKPGEHDAWQHLHGGVEVWAATRHAYDNARRMAGEAADAWQKLADRPCSS